jgi:hypothetical protein
LGRLILTSLPFDTFNGTCLAEDPPWDIIEALSAFDEMEFFLPARPNRDIRLTELDFFWIVLPFVWIKSG